MSAIVSPVILSSTATSRVPRDGRHRIPFATRHGLDVVRATHIVDLEVADWSFLGELDLKITSTGPDAGTAAGSRGSPPIESPPGASGSADLPATTLDLGTAGFLVWLGAPTHPDWAGRFLALLAETGNVSLSAAGAGIDRTTPYSLRQRDQAFADAWAAAEAVAGDALEAEARRRALAGSDALLMFLLRGLKPERYRDRVDVRADLNQQAQRVADRLGITREEVLARAEHLMRGGR